MAADHTVFMAISPAYSGISNKPNFITAWGMPRWPRMRDILEISALVIERKSAWQRLFGAPNPGFGVGARQFHQGEEGHEARARNRKTLRGVLRLGVVDGWR